MAEVHMFAPLLLPVMVACVQVESNFAEALSSEGVYTVLGDLDHGDFAYDGIEEEVFDIQGTSWGRGAGKKRAEKSQGANSYSIDVSSGVLEVVGRTSYRRAGIDFDLLGPDVMDMDVVSRDGNVYLEDVAGYHIVTADEIVSTRLIGDVDFYANEGMDVEIWPFEDGFVTLDSVGGDVVLYLPYGGDYDMQVWADPEYGLEITELGFDNFYLSPVGDYFAGSRGTESIEITVYLSGGSFSLLESR